ncbi:hypothetical protein [Streptomyces sp. LN785]|uniref:hypothetical protein n=1 Tax=Streptomyces sp. LN785 TaxID=3112983 RepID=UPI00371CF603
MTSTTQAKSRPAPSITSTAAVALIEAVRTAAEGVGFEVAVAVVDTSSLGFDIPA